MPPFPRAEIEAEVRAALKMQLFSEIVNVMLTGLDKGYAQLELPYSKKLTQQNGFLHGAVIGNLADNSCAAAAATEVGHVVTQEYKINFLSPAIGKRFIGKGYVIRAGKRQVICRSDIFAISEEGHEKLIATALATILPVAYEPEKL